MHNLAVDRAATPELAGHVREDRSRRHAGLATGQAWKCLSQLGAYLRMSASQLLLKLPNSHLQLAHADAAGLLQAAQAAHAHSELTVLAVGLHASMEMWSFSALWSMHVCDPPIVLHMKGTRGCWYLGCPSHQTAYNTSMHFAVCKLHDLWSDRMHSVSYS